MNKPKKKRIKTSSCKAKGRALQNHIVSRILYHFPWLGENDASSRSMGAAGTDVIMSPLARRTLPLSIEAKKTKATPSRKELEQSRHNCYGTTAPCVVWCPHGCGPQKSMILFDLEDFLEWYKDIAEEKLHKLEGDTGGIYAKADEDAKN